MQIAVFGSAFDPPHIGHELVIQSLLANGSIDEVWLLPIGDHVGRKSMTANKHRFAMAKMVSIPGTRIERCELDRGSSDNSYLTLTTLQRRHPKHDFSLVIGADKLAGFNCWIEYKRLLQEFPIYVVPRPDYPLHPLYDGMFVRQPVNDRPISSTRIRNLVGAGQPIDGLVNQQIANYIAKFNLYE